MTYKVVVPVSGGKDSQSCMKLAVEEFGPDAVLGLFCDTKFEHPKTYAHVQKIQELYGARIVTVNAGSVEEKCLKYKRFPGGGARHCTDELKISPSKKFYAELAKEQGGFVVYYGMRFGESHERSERYKDKVSHDIYAPHEIMPSKYPKYLADLGIVFKLPVLEWSEAEIFDYLGGKHNPLYDEGMGRVGCFPCLAGGDVWKEKAFQHDDFGRAQYIKVLEISEKIGKPIFTSKGGCQRNNKDQIGLFDGPGCAVCEI